MNLGNKGYFIFLSCLDDDGCPATKAGSNQPKHCSKVKLPFDELIFAWLTAMPFLGFLK